MSKLLAVHDDRGMRVAAVNPCWERRFRTASAVLSAGVVAIGLVVLVGWILDIALFKSVFPTFETMKANTAVLFVVLGIGLWLARSRAPRAIRAKRSLGLVVALGAAVTLAEYVLELDLGLDELLIRDPLSVAYPGRMAPATGVTFLLLALALVLQDRPLLPRMSQVAALIAEIIALIGLFGYLYSAPSFYAVGVYTSLALPTAVAFLLAASAFLLARPTEDITRLLTSDSAAGRVLRRLLPAILLVPVILGWVQLRGQAAGYYDAGFGVALMTLSTVIALTCFSSIIATFLHRSELRGLEIETARQRLLEDMQVAQTRLEADVEAMTRLNQRLRDSEQRFRALVDASAQIVWSTDATGTVMEDSPSWRAFTGQTYAQLRGSGWRDALHPEDRDRATSAWRDAVRAKVSLANEVRVRHGSGQWRWMSVRAVPLRDPEGNVWGWIGMNMDITPQMLAEAGRERQLREMVENAPHAVAMLDRDMRYLEVSPRWLPEHLLGPDVPDVIGKSHYEIFPEIPEHWKAVHRRCLAGATEQNDGEPFIRPDGRVQWIRWKICPWHDLEGAIAGILIYGEDITAQRELTRNLEARVEERTKEVAIARDRLDGLISMAADAIIAIDDDQRITIFNQGAEEIFGWTREEVLGKPLDLLLPEHSRGLHHAQVASFASEPTTARPMAGRREVLGLRKNGEAFPAEATISQQRTDGRAQFTVILRDITARRRLADEQARIHAERAVLLKEIHHRVKNNLQVISSLFYLQAQRTDQKSVCRLLDESRVRLQSIALIHEKLYRSEQLASIDFGDYLRDLTANLTSAIGVQAPHVEVRVEAEEIFLDIDRAIPCALLVNELVSNSMKHAFPGGRAGVIRIAVTRADSELEVEVSDAGIGFPADLDFRNATTLGLQLVMSLTKQLRGTVELVRSEGTTFRIHVPASVRSSGPRPPPTLTSGSPAGGPVSQDACDVALRLGQDHR